MAEHGRWQNKIWSTDFFKRYLQTLNNDMLLMLVINTLHMMNVAIFPHVTHKALQNNSLGMVKGPRVKKVVN